MSGVVISSRIQAAPVARVSARIRLKEDRLVNLWYETGNHYIDRLQSRIRVWKAFDEQFTRVRRRVSFKSLTPQQLIDRLRTHPAFWDWWARNLKMICSEAGDTILTHADLVTTLRQYGAPIPEWVLDKIFPK